MKEMTPRERMRRVIDFGGPDRIGMTFSALHGKPRLNDFTSASYTGDPDFDDRRHERDGRPYWYDVWGNLWSKADERHSGEVVEGVLQDWSQLDDLKIPDYANPARYERSRRIRQEHPNAYCVGALPACSFALARKMRRMDIYLEDCALYPDHVRELNRRVNDLVVGMAEQYAAAGLDAVFFCEDWGTQDRLLVSPNMWKNLFLFAFEKLIGRCQELGVDVWMHSCGMIEEIMDPLIECGVAAFQFDQQSVYGGLEGLNAKFGGRVVFHCPVDIQTVLQTRDKDTIQAYARKARELLGGHNGGFVAKDYGDNAALGITAEEQNWAYEAWLECMHY